MSLDYVKKIIRSGQKGLFAPFVGIAATAQQSLKHRSVVRIFIDKEGDWHNRRRDATFVSPQLHALSLEAVEQAVLDQWCWGYSLKSGDLVVDVGAGVGDDAVIFSKLVGPTGRVIAIEAHPRTFRCLLKTIELSGLNNVTAVNAAVSDQDGEIHMSNDADYKSNHATTDNHGMTVQARRLDDILIELDSLNPNLVKMNIEGAESAALRGMADTLRVLPQIVVSCHDFIADAGGDAALRTYDDVKNFLQRAGYDVRKKREDTRPWIPYYLYGRRNI